MTPDGSSSTTLETLVTQAVFGDKEALEHLVREVHKPVYNLALRMLRYPQFAEDATQEILIKVVTHLSPFRHESAFMTWVYKIALNHLLSHRKKTLGEVERRFDEIAERLTFSLELYQPSPEQRYEDNLLSEEVKRSCTLGMLMALSAKQRMALILGDIYEVDSREAAYILNTSPQAFRKRLSRARSDLVGFVSRHCGVVQPEKPCRCHKHVGNKIKGGQLDPDNLVYATETDTKSQEAALEAQRTDLARHQKAAALLRSHPSYQGNTTYWGEVKKVLERSAPTTDTDSG